MKLTIYRSPDADNTGGGNNAGLDLGGLGLGDDSLVQGKQASGNAGAANDGANGQNSQGNAGTGNSANASNQQAIDDAAKKAADDKAKADATAAASGAGANSGQQNAAPTAIEVEGVTYQIDAKGDALDKDGKVFKTKDEITALAAAQQADDLPVVEEVIQRFGITPLDDKGQPKKYEDSVDGIFALANDIAVEKARQDRTKFFTDFPEVADYAKFLARGGDKNEYFKKQSSSWSNIQFDSKNESHLTDAISAELLASGMTKEQVDLTVKMYKDTDKLKEFGEPAYKRLVAQERVKDQQQEQTYREGIAQEQAKMDAHWNTVNSVIKKGTLHNIIIPEADRDAFFSYVAFDADGNGNSKEFLERGKLPVEQQLQLSYLQFKGFDLQKLIATAVKSEQTKTLKLRLSKGQQGVGGGEGIDKGKYSKPNAADVDINKLY